MKTRTHSLRNRIPITVAALLVAALAASSLHAAGLKITEKKYEHDGEVKPAFVIENDWYAATVVPARGGRILEWFDKKAGRNLIYDNGYGGLLDDHGARIKLPYEARWIKRGTDEVVIELSVQDNMLVMAKTLRFFAGRPVIQVSYHMENHGQKPARMLFRNVVRPGGTGFTKRELYCYSRIVGLQRGKGMPRTDDQADPWCALVDPLKKSVVAAAFEGDALERLYTWRGSVVAPTFEFMFNQLGAGKQMDTTYCWLYAHGLTAVDYAHRAFLAQVEGGLKGGQLAMDIDLLATWVPMPDLKVSVEVLDEERNALAHIKPKALPLATLDTPMRMAVKVALPKAGKYVVALLKLESSVLGKPVIVEKAFPLNNNRKLLALYRRPVRWIGKPVAQRPIAGWKKEVKYVIQPDATDRKRGCMVFEEDGEQRGQRVEQIAFDLTQGEPESFPIHFHSLARTGEVKVTPQAPEGFTLETFVPEKMPQKLWGRVYYGLKLHPGDRFSIKPGDDRVVYFRLRAARPKPGTHKASLTFTMQGVAPMTIRLTAKVYPIRFARHPFMVFDVNNLVNYLSARTRKYVWAPTKAHNYLRDMETHGVRGQTMIGMNSPSSHYWYNRVRVRATGEMLPDAIRKTPERFRGRLDLPALDFSYWDILIDWLLEHGQTHVKWPMGGVQQGFMAKHGKLTQLVYGRTLPLGDIRDMTLKEWYFRELVRYLRDRGMTRILCTIDDEIPSEKLAWWVQHAYRCIQMGIEPGLTQSAETIADNTRIHMLAPFMKYWIVGTLNKEKMALRRSQGIIRPEHWVTTYHSSANHWRPYDQMRGHCGLNPAFFDLDALWIQVYYRWRQAEAVIYPGKDGPTSSAAWEGARDGFDDGNYLLLARAMIKALPDRAARDAYTERLEQIVGMKETSFIRFVDRLGSVGEVTTMGRFEGRLFKPGYDTTRFRAAKGKLLDLVMELAPKAPVQKAAADYGLHPLIRDGRSVLRLPKGMKSAAPAVSFLRSVAGDLAFDAPQPETVDKRNPYPVFFMGTLAELKQLLPALAAHPDMAGVSPKHPAAGTYVVRFLRKQPNLRKKEKLADMPESLVILGDAAGLDKAARMLPNIITTPKTLYSHWLLSHQTRR